MHGTPTLRLIAGLSFFCDYAGRTSPRAGHRVRSRQAGTVAEEANEKVRLASRKERAVKRGERSDFHYVLFSRIIYLGLLSCWMAGYSWVG